MGIINWRREALFLAVAGMETCWVVAWSRVLLSRPEPAVTGISWWSVLALYVVALAAARAVGHLELHRGPWFIGVAAFLTSLLLLRINLGSVLQNLDHLTDPSIAKEILTLLVGFIVWFRALGIPAQAGDTRSIARHFQVGVLILVVALLVTEWFSTQMTDLVIVYFGFGLLAVALTRIEEVARTDPSGAAPFDLKWVMTLAMTLLIAGFTALLTTQVFTVETTRWLLRPFVMLLNIILFVLTALATLLIAQIWPLIRWLLGFLSLEEAEQTVEELGEFTPLDPQNEMSDPSLLIQELAKALGVILLVALILVALWVVVRSFRRWQMHQYATPGGVRDTVSSDGTVAEDLKGFLHDQWQRIREAADLSRLLRRDGTGSARAIYANMLALLAAANRPRRPEQTPYEFVPIAVEVLPTRQAEIAAITEAYVRARYGEVTISAEKLAWLQEAWERIKADSREQTHQSKNAPG